MPATYDVRLVFLISQPRSGSTLLQHVLAGSPHVHTVTEPWLMLHPIYALRPSGYEAEYDAKVAHAALIDFLESFPSGRDHYYEAIGRMALYLYGRACQETGKNVFLDKTPRYYFIMSELAQLFPDAKFIVLLRNPLAVLWSVIQTWVRGNLLLLGDYSHDLVTAPSRLVEGIDLLGDRAIVVSYEEFVRHPQAETSRLCQFLDLAYMPSMLEYDTATLSQGRLGDPTGIYRSTRPDASRLEQWLSLGKSSQTRYLARKYLDILGSPLVQQLGYHSDALLNELATVKLEHRQIVIPWRLVFKSGKSLADKFILVLLSSLQQRKPVYSYQEIRYLVKKNLFHR